MVYLLRPNTVRSGTLSSAPLPRHVDEENLGRVGGNVGDGGSCEASNVECSGRDLEGCLGRALQMVTVMDLRKFWKDCSTKDFLRRLPLKESVSLAAVHKSTGRDLIVEVSSLLCDPGPSRLGKFSRAMSGSLST